MMGGLGNQLFQFATGLEVAKRAGTSLVLDLAWYGQRLRRDEGVTLRPFELSAVARGITISPGPRGPVGELVRHGTDVAMRRLSRSGLGRSGRLIFERGQGFDPDVLGAEPGARLSGYFASWRYFPSVADQVRSRIRDAVQPSAWSREAMSQSKEAGVIALHVRRGDYLELASMYGHVTPSYYVRAVDVLRQMGKNGPLWLFSDEPDGAVAWLGAAVRPDRVVAEPPGTTSLESMAVMAAAAGLIIVNSTFSWWAAFLDDSRLRPVVAPRPSWASSARVEPRDLLLPHWITVDCRD